MQWFNFADLLQENSSMSMRKSPYSHLWYACRDGHLEKVRRILKNCDKLDSITKECPDGTSPITIALLKGHKNILDYFSKEHNIEMKLEDTTNISDEKSLLTHLSYQFPVFNSSVEAPLIDQTNSKIKLLDMGDMKKYILGDLCPIMDFWRENQQLPFIGNIKPRECRHDCNK